MITSKTDKHTYEQKDAHTYKHTAFDPSTQAQCIRSTVASKEGSRLS